MDVSDHTFMKGGRFPDRVTVAKLNGQVFERTNPKGRSMRTVRSGVFLPNEMVTGRTADVFRKGVAEIVATTVVSKLGSLLA